jgi:hypothetical protein
MKNKTNFIIDFAIFFGFLLAMEPRITGENLHEWFSVAVALTIVAHVVLHWDWIIQVAAKYFAKLWHSSRLNFILDVLLFIGINAIMISGLMISRSVLPTLGINVAQSGTWKMVHRQAADLTMWVVALHLGLHWNWIWNMIKKLVVRPVSGLFAKKPAAVVVPVQVEYK